MKTVSNMMAWLRLLVVLHASLLFNTCDCAGTKVS